MQTSIASRALTIGQAEPTLRLGLRPRTEFFEPHWYAAYTCANHEKGVTQQLERRSVECFLPLYESVRRWKDRRVQLQLPLFPGYVFVRLALRDRHQVLEIPSVVRLVGFDRYPTPLPVEEIETIRTCLTRRQILAPLRYVRSGQQVRLLSGPLEGLTRFVISLELLQRSVAVEIDRSDFDSHPAL